MHDLGDSIANKGRVSELTHKVTSECQWRQRWNHYKGKHVHPIRMLTDKLCLFVCIGFTPFSKIFQSYRRAQLNLLTSGLVEVSATGNDEFFSWRINHAYK